MADSNSKFNFGKLGAQSSQPGSSQPARPSRLGAGSLPRQGEIRISCRATNPLSIQDDLSKVFQDPTQAKATTATRLFRNEELFTATAGVVSGFLSSTTRNNFSMWSAGCSSGEEVYSMAMIALYEFEKNKRQAHLEAFGTDINDQRIMEARSGRYGRPGKDAFSQNYWRLLQKYAQIGNSAVQMGEQLMTVCKFKKFDMRNKPKNHTFNFIVCNHVLQYYDGPGQQHIIGNLKAVLKPGGKLYLEGVTDGGTKGLNLVKIQGTTNMYEVGGR